MSAASHAADCNADEAIARDLQLRWQYGCAGHNGLECYNTRNEGYDHCTDCYEALSTCKTCKFRMLHICGSFYQCDNVSNCEVARLANGTDYDEWNAHESKYREKNARASYDSKKHQDFLNMSKASKDSDGNPKNCPICLEEFEENESVSSLDCCKLQYHTHCMDEWFKQSTSCPTCRKDIDKNKKRKK